MSTEQNLGQPPVRRRMAGYTQLARQPEAPTPATEPDAPVTAPAPSEPAAAPVAETPASQPVPPTPAGQQDVAPAAQAPNAPAPETQAEPVPVAAEAPARKRRMGSAPAPLPSATPVPVPVSGAPATGSSSPGEASVAARTGEARGPVSAEPVGQPPEASAAAPVRKRRMGGAPATPAAQSAGAAAPMVQDGDPALAQGTPAATTDVTPAPTVAAPKRRMGGAPAAQASTASAPAAPGTSASSAAGSAGTAPAPRQRMGGAPAAAGSNAAAANAPATAAPTAAASTVSSTAGATATGRAGTPGPAGAATPVAPQRPWLRPVVITAALVVVAALVVLGARWLRTLDPVAEFIATYDGHASQPESAPAGIPGWLGWQHFFNMFFIVLIIRTGLAVRTERKPPGYWTAKPDSFFSPKGNTPKKVSLSQWLHQSLDVLWVLNGIIFVVLLVVTGHWARIVPTSWDIFPNMVSGAIQYASLDWPVENGWVHYNALQVMAYFTTVFIAAPLAILTGIRISTWWPERVTWLNRAYPVEWARAVHFPVMLYFVAFTLVHVFLVFFTGALANLNHMYTSRDVVDWWGLVIFLASLVVIAAAWFLTKPLFTTPIAARMGKVTK